jgi:hypothetical protein
MRLRSKIAATALVIGIAAVPAIASVASAQASNGEICAQSGTGFCMNDWNGGGSGNAVKMGQSGWSHQAFITVALTTACGHGTVTGTCPFTNLALDSDLFGEPIVAVKYTPNGLCLGLSNSGGFSGFLETCPNSAGVGGGWGVNMVEDFGCRTHLDDVRVSDNKNDGSPWNWRSPGVTGGQIVVTNNRDGGSCWG